MADEVGDPAIAVRVAFGHNLCKQRHAAAAILLEAVDRPWAPAPRGGKRARLSRHLLPPTARRGRILRLSEPLRNVLRDKPVRIAISRSYIRRTLPNIYMVIILLPPP